MNTHNYNPIWATESWGARIIRPVCAKTEIGFNHAQRQSADDEEIAHFNNFRIEDGRRIPSSVNYRDFEKHVRIWLHLSCWRI